CDEATAGQEGEIIAPNATRSTIDVTTFAKLRLGVETYSSGVCVMPFELLEDTQGAAVNALAQILAARIARRQNRRLTGLILAQAPSVAAGWATALTYDDLVALIHSVDEAYREGAAFQMSDPVLKQVRLIKDGGGRPVLKRGEGNVPTVLNYPVL